MENLSNIVESSSVADKNESDGNISGIALNVHRSLVADYDSNSSSSESYGTVDSEPDSDSETESDDVEIVEKIIKPVEEITITVPKEQSQVVGTIKYIVEDQVVIEPRVGLAALDLGTILFLEEGRRALGRIDDVLGPVTEPFYCVIFSSAQDIETKQIKPGLTVYYAPSTDHTSYVPLPTLMKQKGSDASWEHNEEVPEELLDFSDDEEEAKIRGGSVFNNETRSHASNKRNHRNWFERRGRGGRGRGNMHTRHVQPLPREFANTQPPPLFNPNVPPPNFNLPPPYHLYQQFLCSPPPPPSLQPYQQNNPFQTRR